MNYIDSIYTDPQLGTELVTYALTATLHAKDCNRPYLTFYLPAEEAQYFAPVEYSVPIPPSIEWPYMSYGEFSVDAVVTLNASTLEVVSLNDVRPNPSLPGGF